MAQTIDKSIGEKGTTMDSITHEEVTNMIFFIKNHKTNDSIGTSQVIKPFAIQYNITFEHARNILYTAFDSGQLKLNSDYTVSVKS